MKMIFFDNWDSIIRLLVIGVLAYVALVLLLRISGKRTLSKMNAFDFVVTVALGSTLATVLLNKSIPLSEGVLAFALLISLQFLITWLSVRYKAVGRLVKSEPTLLAYRGRFLEKAMKQERITEDELLAVMRQNNVTGVENTEAIVLETDGTLSVIGRTDQTNVPVLRNVRDKFEETPHTTK